MLGIDKLNEAFDIIRTKGVKGSQAASFLVGRDVALGMLVFFLRRQWSVRDATAKDTVKDILERENLLNVVECSPILGRGIVYDGGAPTHSIEVEKMYEPASVESLHIGMWMQGPGDYLLVPAGVFPFRNVYDELQRAHIESVKKLHQEIGIEEEDL